MEMWRVVAAIVMGPAVSLVGVALATNFRGVTEWHMRRSMSAASVLRRVPPWRWLPNAPHEERLARFILLDRLIGVAIAMAGVMILVNVGYSVLTGQPMQTVK
ncbi:hypothetical protein GAR05_06544 [Micromonospora saelicesensis]|uniref:Uncharacterized protein n=1 Tax=Micromonospora saelicesensis TaxID=285676 RepID=A0ABX9C8K7_9ACTN|nr:hypothetical protein [Micromonospora saelicesensis]RAN91980.1 hypothetical protein GAR05_06544 [Micromonospora saelicesensis]RAO43726.1 hypothetical protein PSN01_05895 [Micromonospora saelicesensis]